MTSILQAAKEFVTKIFEKEEINQRLNYHNIRHIQAVVGAAEEIASHCNLSKEDEEVIQLAAWFHDIGYVRGFEDHEEKGREMARDFLYDHHYPADNITKVENCIMATRLPQTPHGILEEIICDSDMIHLASSHYLERAEALRQELEKRHDISIDQEEWMRNNARFLRGHSYFTDYARKHFGPAKEDNHRKILKLLDEAG